MGVKDRQTSTTTGRFAGRNKPPSGVFHEDDTHDYLSRASVLMAEQHASWAEEIDRKAKLHSPDEQYAEMRHALAEFEGDPGQYATPKARAFFGVLRR